MLELRKRTRYMANISEKIEELEKRLLKLGDCL
jgi:hypothetical protein